MTMNYSTGGTIRGKLGPAWDTPEAINADIDAQLAAQQQAFAAESKGIMDWAALDSGRKDFTGSVSAGPFGAGVNLTGWMNFAKRYSQVEEFSFNNADMKRSTGGHLHYVNCDMRGMDATASEMSGAVFENCTFDENTKFNGCSMKNVKFVNSPTAQLASYTDSEWNEGAFDPDPTGRGRETGISKPEGVKIISNEVKLPQQAKTMVDLIADANE